MMQQDQIRAKFYADKDIQKVSSVTDLKLNVRNILGVKHKEDWIFNLNIGNVMHLAPLSVDDMSIHTDSTHELTRDAMLEKIILLSVSNFCVGTELRFLALGDGKKGKDQIKIVEGEEEKCEKGDKKPKYTKLDSEMWHGKALEISSTLLPSECPLVGHVITSYNKHHAPVSQSIPENEPLIEELTVIHPLNEAKTDTVNYH